MSRPAHLPGSHLALAVVLAVVSACARNRVPTPNPVASINRPPFVRITCDPCSVEPGAPLQLLAEASDPDGDRLDYAWRGIAGSFADAATAAATWISPARPGAFPVAVTVSDGRGGAASDSITVNVRDRTH
jgi:PKD domain